jgi:hypothetical protein
MPSPSAVEGHAPDRLALQRSSDVLLVELERAQGRDEQRGASGREAVREYVDGGRGGRGEEKMRLRDVLMACTSSGAKTS